jgi:ketosteroid isomerase-like protein
MKKLLKILAKGLLILTFALPTHAQEDSLNENDAIAQEVDSTLWKAFKKAYEAKDAAAFNSLHTDDVMRITPDKIRIGEEYKRSNIKSFMRNPEREQQIDFAMEHRVYHANHGYEVGYYRIIYTADGKVEHTSYAQFHVRLLKEKGQWKIAQDWDIHHVLGEEFTEVHFNKAEFLDL